MALPYNPFGLRPMGGGRNAKTLSVQLVTDNAETFIGDLILATTAGADKLASDANPTTAQVLICGVAAEYKAANTSGGGMLEVWDPMDTIFEIQANATGDNWTTKYTTAFSAYPVEGTAVAGDSATKLSKVAIEETAHAGHALILIGPSNFPGNDLDANTYPIMMVRIRLAATVWSTVGFA